MKKQEHIDYIVDFLQQTEHDSYNVICDHELRIKFMGNNFQDFATLTNNDLNKLLKETESVLSMVSSQYLEESKKLLAHRTNESNFLTVLNKDNKTQILQTTMRLVSKNSEVVGVYGKSHHEVSLHKQLFSSDEIQKLLEGTPIVIKPQEQQINKLPDISEKNLIILFLIVMGKIDKQIADFINILYDTQISASGITKIINRSLFSIFNVSSRSALISKAHSMGILNVIPTVLFKNVNSLF